MHMHIGRTPVVLGGYGIYVGYHFDFLAGNFQGFRGLSLKDILRFWSLQKSDIDSEQRFILVTALNENWGTLSSYFPGRTSAWYFLLY